MIDPARKPKVLFVGAFPPEGTLIFGGNVTACRALMKSSLPRRAELDLIDSTQISVPPPSFPVRLMLAVRKLFIFIARVERGKPDVVLLFVALGASVAEKGAMAWYARIRGIPALMFPRGGALIDTCERSTFTRWWTRAAFRSARKVLCQGKKWQDFMTGVLQFARKDAPIITNWTATEDLLAISRERGEGGTKGPVRFLFLGWLDHEKGIFELLEACVRLAPTRRFTLDVVGEGNASATARDFVARKDLGARVRFRGWLRGVELEKAFRESDVLALPSWAEGLPNAMVEAMAAKLAIIATAVGNIPDVITDGVSGLLVPPRNVEALMQALAKMVDEPDLRYRLAEAGNAIARERFAVEPAVDLLVSIIDESMREKCAA